MSNQSGMRIWFWWLPWFIAIKIYRKLGVSGTSFEGHKAWRLDHRYLIVENPLSHRYLKHCPPNERVAILEAVADMAVHPENGYAMWRDCIDCRQPYTTPAISSHMKCYNCRYMTKEAACDQGLE